MKISKKTLFFVAFVTIIPTLAFASGDFYFMGDGKIRIGRNEGGVLKTITFRDNNGQYNEASLRELNQLYGSEWTTSEYRFSLRLIELLDYLEDHYKSSGVHVISGFRDQQYNQGLRDKGKLAASSSMHIDAEAADLIFNGVASSTVYEYLKEKNCCGIGYYHGKTIHIDTGPARYWDEKTSGTETKELPENKYIIVETEKDIYDGREPIALKFARVNEYPIGVVRGMELVCEDNGRKKAKKVVAEFGNRANEGRKKCVVVEDFREAKNIVVKIPEGLVQENNANCLIKLDFCEPMTKKMPPSIESKTFTIRGTTK